jgi:hypothetical protein
MKNSLINLLLAAGVVLSGGCKIRSAEPELARIIQFEETNTIDLEKYVGRVSYVQLENHPESAFSDIDKLLADGSDIFLLDKRLEAVFCFDTTGKFRYRIQQVGKGPGEYGELESIWLKPDEKELWLQSFWPPKIMVYTYDGTMLREFNIQWPAKDMTRIADGLLVAYNITPSNVGKEELKEGLYSMTEEGKAQRQRLILGDSTIYWLLNFQRNLEEYAGGALLLSQSDTVFRIDPGGDVSVDFLIDWGKLRYPDDLRSIGYNSPMASEAMDGDYVLGKDQLIGFGPIRLFRAFRNRSMELALTDLTTGKGFLSHQMSCNNTQIPLLFPLGKSNQGRLIGMYDLPLLVALRESVKESKNSEGNSQVMETLNTLTESAINQDRPILWFATIKEEWLINP